MAASRADRLRRVLLGAALVLGAALLARWLLRPERPARPAPLDEEPTPAVVQERPVPRTPVVRGGLLGINEGISLPSGGGARLLGGFSALPRRVVMLKALGARLVRANSHAWPNLAWSTWTGSYTEADRFVRTLGDAGLDAVVVIGPWPGTRTQLYTDRYVPADLAGYAAWVEALVERYDGDGLDDMPGLARPILAWEVDNEPDHHNQVAPRTGRGDALEAGADVEEALDAFEGDDAERAGPPGTFETPAEYAEVLLATSRAIRRADPEARVLSGGIYRAAMPAGRDYLAEVLAVPGVRDAIDGLSLHCYFRADNLAAVQRTMRTARALAPELPVWITETSVPSEGDQGWVDEEWQARMVAGIVGGFLADGADRVFWHSLLDAPRHAEGPVGYATNSLFRSEMDGSEVRYAMKPAGEVFRRLAGHLDAVDPESIAEVPVEGGRLLETDAGWLAFDGAPALPPEARTVEDLLTGEVELAGERATAPAWIAR